MWVIRVLASSAFTREKWVLTRHTRTLKEGEDALLCVPKVLRLKFHHQCSHRTSGGHLLADSAYLVPASPNRVQEAHAWYSAGA